jgi:hypothetical protein
LLTSLSTLFVHLHLLVLALVLPPPVTQVLQVSSLSCLRAAYYHRERCCTWLGILSDRGTLSFCSGFWAAEFAQSQVVWLQFVILSGKLASLIRCLTSCAGLIRRGARPHLFWPLRIGVGIAEVLTRCE